MVDNIHEFEVKFRPRARILKQLGDQLIKNENIALVELVKNAYDADASFVSITMTNVEEPTKTEIIIEDNGSGMDYNIISNVWMEPGSNFKTLKYRNRDFSPKYHRLPLGEKGIGRFGVHKLGDKIEMITKMENSPEIVVNIDWSILDKYDYLEEVPIKIIERERPLRFVHGQTGTYIKISALRSKWEKNAIRSAKRAFVSLTSPFDEIDSFKIDFKILSSEDYFKGILEWEDIKSLSLFNFNLEIENDHIQKFLYEFTPWLSMQRDILPQTINENDESVKEFLKLENEDGVHFTLKSAHIGKIRFKGYIFDLDNYVLKLGLTQDKRNFKNYLSINGGVKVFRDGLRVYDYGEPENDWLDLNIRRVNQPSKKLSKNILIGAVYIDRSDSEGLEEKTNREGFVENESYEKFKQAILHSIGLIEMLRFNDKRRLKEMFSPTRTSEPVLSLVADLKKYVDEKITDDSVKNQINRYLEDIENDYNTLNENLLKAAGAGLNFSVVIHEAEKIVTEIQYLLQDEKASERAIDLVRHLAKLIEGYSDIIRKTERSNESVTGIVKQAFFNTEFRLKKHEIIVSKDYLNSPVYQSKIKISKSLTVGCLINIIDNSIYWLDRFEIPQKKIYVNVVEDDFFVKIIIADNGLGFKLPTEDIIKPYVSGKPYGIGIGLHIASEVMKAQGGILDFPDPEDIDIPEEFKRGAILSLNFKK